MRIEYLESDIPSRIIGAAVVRTDPSGSVMVEFGPADGPAITRVQLSSGEAALLAGALKAVSNGRDEAVILAEE